MKILVITPIFALAGVPLAQIRFARALLERGHDVELIIGHVSVDFNFESPINLKVRILNKKNVKNMFFPILKYLWKEKPDIIFSAEDHLNIIVLIAACLSLTKAKISCSSRVTPYDTYRGSIFTKGWLLKQLSKLFMRKADALTCVSEDMVLQYKEIFNNSKHVCVYNIVDNTFSRSLMYEEVSHKWLIESNFPIIVAAGRLAPWKGFTNLIHAMALLKAKSNAKLLILGDGPQRQELQYLIEKNNLQQSIDLLGYVTNPYKYFARSNIFVLSSRVEGLPNVLVEAMMCGCTPVSTNCPTGPREVLSDGKYGYLVPVDDPVSLAESIAYALNNPIQKTDLYNAIIPFREDEVINKHFRILGFNQ